MSMQRPPSLSLNTKVNNRYTVLSIVGHGGVGTVYKVQDDVYGNIYALKETFDLSEGARVQFEREARWLEHIDHPHIPHVRQYFQWNNRLYLVMDFVAGENLEQKLIRNNHQILIESQVLQWILPICDALVYLHTQNPVIVHRDVKPANIIVTNTDHPHPVLVDLGIAKEHLPGMHNVTATFISKAGTEGYAPPEQYTSNGGTGPWSDIYSLGATLYHLLTGKLPVPAIDRAALDQQLSAPRLLNPTLSVATESIILRALSIRPQDRFHSMQEMKQAIARSLQMIQGGVPLSAPLRQDIPKGYDIGPMQPAESVSQQPMYPSHPQMPHIPQSGQMEHSSPPAFRQPSSIPVQQPAQHRGSQHINRRFHPLNRGKTPSLPSLPEVGARSAPNAAYNQSGKLKDSIQSNPRLNTFQPAASGVIQLKSRTVYPWHIVVGFLIVGLIAGALVYGTQFISFGLTDRSTPQISVSGYFTSLQKHDYNHAYSYLASNVTNSLSSDAFAQQQQQEQSQNGSIQSFALTTAAGTGTTEQILVTVQQSGNTLLYTVSLTEVNSSWYLDSIPSH